MPVTFAEQVGKIRDRLLPSTLEYAVRESPYYRRTLGTCYNEVRRTGDLRYLPIIDKQTIVANLREIMCSLQPDDGFSFTSGFTSGNPFVVRRSLAEMDEISKWWAQLEIRNENAGRELPLILEIVNDFHGIPVLSGRRNVIRVPAEDTVEGHFSWIRELLSTEFEFPRIERRISIIRTSLRSLQILTLYLLREGNYGKKPEVKKIAVTGSHVSKTWRAFLGEQWQAAIVDSYSLSEFAGNAAIRCELCGYQHFVLPTLIPEVANPVTKEPIEAGLGVLVLTSLYPFAQRQLFIRYWTGDLVERGPRCANDEVGFLLRGRIGQTLLIGDGERVDPLLLPFDVHDVLDGLPDVYRVENRQSRMVFSFLDRELVETLLPLSVRYPVQTLSRGKQYEIPLEVGLNYLPELHPSRVRQLSEEILSQLCIGNPVLASMMEIGTVKINISFLPTASGPPGLEI